MQLCDEDPLQRGQFRCRIYKEVDLKVGLVRGLSGQNERKDLKDRRQKYRPISTSVSSLSNQKRRKEAPTPTT